MSLAELIIIHGDKGYELPRSVGTAFVYSIGSGVVSGFGVENVNDYRRLHEIALEIRDEFTEWIYSFNKQCVDKGLIYKNLSLFLISDCSCKRTELFDTFSSICNLILISEIILKRQPSRIRLIGGNRIFLAGLESVAVGIPILNNVKSKKSYLKYRRVLSDLRFLFEVALIVILKKFYKSQAIDPSHSCRFYFSIFPKMTDSYGRDKKYGNAVSGSDQYAVSIVTDGFHQHVSVSTYFKLRSQINRLGYVLIDENLKYVDWMRGLFCLGAIRWSFWRISKQYSFRGIDVTGWIEEELSQSASRLTRFMVIKGAFERFFDMYPMDEFIYYLHEYSIGRLISWLLATRKPAVLRTGYQHGPAAWRKLVYFIAPQEASDKPDYTQHVPLPSRVLAEDKLSLDIYHYAGYRDVSVMKKVHRLDYLDSVQPRLDTTLVLIAPGLHDGEIMLKSLIPLFQEELKKTFLLKPHPLANNCYVSLFENQVNLMVTTEALQHLLERVGEVFVTYSSVGLEAYRKGIPVRIVDIPGVVNESPLGDLIGFDNRMVGPGGEF